MTAGNILPGLSWVLALNCLQNSIILIPLEPNAGPTGGDGFAAPPLICNLISPAISLAIIIFIFVVKVESTVCNKNRLFLFYLCEAEFERSFPSENHYHYFEFFLFVMNFFNDAAESGKRTEYHFHVFAYIEWG